MTRTFRLFISSTFSDLEEERNALHRRVFPALQELCEAKGARFQAIDLRWGVSDEAGLDQRTMPLCLDEIDRCQKADRPNFLILLGDRYGWRPLPTTIPVSEMDAITSRMDDEARRRLADWYVRDDNAVPAEYYLKPRDPDGPFGTSHDEREKADKSLAWEREAAAIRTSLLSAIEQLDLSSDRYTDAEARSKYVASATEQEIEHGAFRVPDAPDHVFCFLRHIDGLPENASAEMYRDMARSEDGTVAGIDAAAEAALKRLKQRLADYLPGNVITTTVAWVAGRPQLELDAFCRRVKAQLSAAIEARLAVDEGVEGVAVEAEAHAGFARERARFFVGRDALVGAVERYLADPGARPLVVHGAPGCGKSALVARVGLDASARMGTGAVVLRFVGATAASTGGRGLLGGLCQEIGAAYGVADTVPDDPDELARLFAERLTLATAERPLSILMDAVDQLAQGDPARRLGWLPTTLPDHVRLVISTIPGDTLDAAAARNPSMIEVTPMPGTEAATLLDVWLTDAGRALLAEQRAHVLGRFEAGGGLPLYLKLAFEEARLWRSDAPHPPLAPDIGALIRDNLFARLSAPANHGSLLVSRAMGYLAASRYGLAEDEIIAVLSRDDDVFRSIADLPHHRIPETGEGEPRIPVVVWARLRSDLEPYLVQRSADGATTLDFYHRQFRATAVETFLAGNDGRVSHGTLADLFRAKADPHGDGGWRGDDPRGLSELPYHLTESGRFDDVYDVLTDFTFMERKAAEVAVVAQADGSRLYTGVSRLRDDYDHALSAMAGGDPTDPRRRIILTGVDLGNGLEIRCPHCNRSWPFDDGWRGSDIDCPGDDCRGPLRINPFVVGEDPNQSKETV